MCSARGSAWDSREPATIAHAAFTTPVDRSPGQADRARHAREGTAPPRMAAPVRPARPGGAHWNFGEARTRPAPGARNRISSTTAARTARSRWDGLPPISGGYSAPIRCFRMSRVSTRVRISKTRYGKACRPAPQSWSSLALTGLRRRICEAAAASAWPTTGCAAKWPKASTTRRFAFSRCWPATPACRVRTNSLRTSRPLCAGKPIPSRPAIGPRTSMNWSGS